MNINPATINEADRVLHSLAQLVALTGTQLLDQQPDDSHANMGWNSTRQRLEGRPFIRNGQAKKLVIDTETFTLAFIDQAEAVVASFSPETRMPADALAWWKSQLQAWDLQAIKPLNYQLDPPVAPDTPYVRPAGLRAWGQWRTLANTSLDWLNEWSGRSSEVRVWPHHFDTGVYYSLRDATGRERAAIWAGYAIADSLSNEPYFYLSGYDSTRAVNFRAAPTLSAGRWLITDDWKGAFLPLSAIETEETVTVFLGESYTWLDQRVAPS
ncbi:hypothetical protein DYU11_13510 [Fibrisoma montanum]|uniref:Uncharacterized protein n=1 Tax=Fibrisoma montanum TaxID=2305895 RepID=A0A418MC84_9BACT|nr:hypothetical protein [Fibrisoma montanum]RIV23975.1 hypothetical protein DYU11_13510 [Fibrisoma montanum]